MKSLLYLFSLHFTNFQHWFTNNGWGILGASALLSLGLLVITSFILFNLQDFKKCTLFTFLILSFLSVSFSIFIYCRVLSCGPGLAY